MAKNKNYKAGDAEGNVQNPAAMMSLNYLLGSQGSQRNAGGTPVGAMYGGQPGVAGAAGPAPSVMQFPGSGAPLPQRGRRSGMATRPYQMPQGGGQQSANQPGFGMTGVGQGLRGGGQQKNVSQMGGGGYDLTALQKGMPGQASNMMAPQQALATHNQAQRTAFAPQQGAPVPQTIPASDYGNLLGKNAPKTQPINSGAFDMDAWATGQRLAGNSVVGQTAGEDYIQNQMMQDAMGGARDRFGAGMSSMMPGMLH